MAKTMPKVLISDALSPAARQTLERVATAPTRKLLRVGFEFDADAFAAKASTLAPVPGFDLVAMDANWLRQAAESFELEAMSLRACQNVLRRHPGAMNLREVPDAETKIAAEIKRLASGEPNVRLATKD